MKRAPTWDWRTRVNWPIEWIMWSEASLANGPTHWITSSDLYAKDYRTSLLPYRSMIHVSIQMYNERNLNLKPFSVALATNTVASLLKVKYCERLRDRPSLLYMSRNKKNWQLSNFYPLWMWTLFSSGNTRLIQLFQLFPCQFVTIIFSPRSEQRELKTQNI